MLICGIQLGYDDEESPEQRTARVVDLIVRNADADLIVLPELWEPTGFGYRTWAQRAQAVDGPTMRAISQAAANTDSVIHAGSIIERAGDKLWNTSVLFDRDGSMVATYRKIHRFGFSVGEPELLQAGEQVVVAPLHLDGRTVSTGLATCYDLRFPELFRAVLDRGAELVLVVAAWPQPRVEAWRLLLRARAIENQQVVVGVNTAGTHAGATMGGHSTVVGPDGTVLAQAGADQEVLRAEVDLGSVTRIRTDFPVLADRRSPGTFAGASGSP